MCEPFTIRSWADPTREYTLRDIEKFREIYEPQGFYVVDGPHSYRRQRALAQREQGVVETVSNPEGTADTIAVDPYPVETHDFTGLSIWTDAEPTESVPTPADDRHTDDESPRQGHGTASHQDKKRRWWND